MKKNQFLLCTLFFCLSSVLAQTGNVGIGTTTPTTKLDVNGALTSREASVTVTVGAGPVTINSLTHSQFRLTAATAAFTITGPTTSNGSTALVAGARMVIVNASGQTGTLNGFVIANGSAQEFVYSNGIWVATHGGVQPDYDWLRMPDGQVPTNPNNINSNIYHLGGNIGIGTNAPTAKVDVEGGHIELEEGFSLRWGADNTGERIYGAAGPSGSHDLRIEAREMMYFTADRNNTVTNNNQVGFVWGTPAERMRLTDAGNLGIGVSNPTEKLHVNTTTAGEGIALSQTSLTNVIMLNANANGPILSFINNSPNTDAASTAFIQHREPNAPNGFANDIQYQTANGTHVFMNQVGIFESAPLSGFALDVNGQIVCNWMRMQSYAGTGNREIGVDPQGDIIIFASDSRLKKDIYEIKEGLNKVMRLRPVNFSWNDTEKYGAQIEVGFIAQEVKEVIPEITGTFTENGEVYNTINYAHLVPVLTKAIQEQQTIIETQTRRITGLESKAAASDALIKRVEHLEQMLKKIMNDRQ